jgi:hypothetical protein
LGAPELNSLSWLGLASKTPHLPTFATSSPIGSAGALEIAARARSVPLGRSRWPIEPGRLRWGARNGRSNSLELARLRRCARNCMAWLVESIAPPDFTISSPPGSAGALNIAARARSAALGRSKWPLELARLRQSARNCSARLLENITHVDVSEFEPARLYWGPRHWRSRPLGSAGAPEIAAGT